MLPPGYTPDTSALPSYESSVFLNDVVRVKLEHTTPLKRNGTRRWLFADATLNNTQIVLKFNGSTTDRVLSLQFAQVGFAADYSKGMHPVRLRAEGMQILLDFEKLLDAVKWIHALRLAIDISLPIDLRVVPPEKYQTARTQGRRKHYCSPKLDEKDHEISGDDVSIETSSSSSSTSSSSSGSSSSLVEKADVPDNVFISLKDFGVILLKQTWEGSHWYINRRWSLIENNSIYTF